jgi:hypothetical protein
MKISEREQQVLDFQVKYGSSVPRLIGDEPLGNKEHDNDTVLMRAASQLQSIESQLGAAALADRSDPRLLRAKLMVSELAEVVEALMLRNEVELADGLADLEYVTVGTAVTYHIPLGEVFNEVHASNMTKHTVQEAVANHSGDKGKGPDFKPPQIAAVIAKARSVA